MDRNTFYRGFVAVAVGLLWLAVVYGAMTARREHFEDGSGLLTVYGHTVVYCLPLHLCE